jgi:hypothetical protein
MQFDDKYYIQATMLADEVSSGINSAVDSWTPTSNFSGGGISYDSLLDELDSISGGSRKRRARGDRRISVSDYYLTQEKGG